MHKSIRGEKGGSIDSQLSITRFVMYLCSRESSQNVTSGRPSAIRSVSIETVVIRPIRGSSMLLWLSNRGGGGLVGSELVLVFGSEVVVVVSARFEC